MDGSVMSTGDVMTYVLQAVLDALHIMIHEMRLVDRMVVLMGLVVHLVAVAVAMVRPYPHIGSWNSHCLILF